MDIKTLFTQNKKQFFYYVIGVLIITPSNIMLTFAVANAFNMFEVSTSAEIINIIYSFGNFFLGIIVLFVISPILAVSTTIASILLYILTKLFEKPSIERKQRVLKENSKFHKSLTNILNGLETIKLYQVMGKFRVTFDQDISELELHKKSSNQINLIQGNIMQWITASYQIFVIVFAAYLFSQGKILLTSLVVVFNFTGQLIYSSLIICDEIFASLDHEIGESIESHMLKVNKTLINVSHIIYEDNIKLYDLIYLVKNNKVSKINNFQEVKDLGLFLG